jgi:uncharacterized protein DUF6624
MLSAVLALTLVMQQAPADATLAARVSQLFQDFALSDDTPAHKAVTDKVQELIAERGLLTVAEVGNEASYTLAMLACETSSLGDRDRLLAKLRTAAAKHEIPADAVTYCEVHTKQDRVKAAAARRPPVNPTLRDEIQRLYARDQAVRLGKDLDPQSLEKTDRELNDPLEQIFANYGVPTYAAVGSEAASQFAVMIQHQPPDFRRKVLPKLKANVDAGQGDGTVYAMMYDRASTDEGRPQRFGENFVCDDQHPDLHPAPIEDEANVNERRAAVGRVRLELQARIITAVYGTSLCRRAAK